MLKARHEIWAMRHAALSDHLTGIGNRRFLEGRLRAIIAEYSHGNGDAGLLFIDVDHFKQFNDIYGHELGDKMLQMVASNLNHNLRATDTIGRWGGEEFMVVLHEVQGQKGLLKIASKLQKMVELSRFDLNSHSLTVAISVGATLLRPDDNVESIVRRADQLMYKSKMDGRNRVTLG
jgi:diguanylate cyclase (GGDEF)-like protein